jgi:cytochrome c-type protein NapB
MKLISTMTLSLATVGLLFIGCGDAKPQKSQTEAVAVASVSEESLGLRKTGIYEEDNTQPAQTSYRASAQGESVKIKRAFQDAPPMIPHSIDGLLPITADYNSCTGCHMPDVAMYMDPKPTPIPKSHFLDMRPKHNYDGKLFTKSIDNYENETDVKKIDHLSNARFNCSQCHAPQSRGNLAVENTFEATYQREGAEFKSTWTDVMMDDLDTVGKESHVTKKDIANDGLEAGKSAWGNTH